MSKPIGAILASACLAVSGCASAPVRQAGQAPALSSSVEAGLRHEFEEFEQRILRSGIRNSDPALNEYVRRVGCDVAGKFCSELRFYVIESSDFNAAMAPNGMLIVNSGLLLRIESESELVLVLGHEFGHYFGNDVLEMISRTKGASAVGSVLMVGLAFTGVGAFASLGYTASMLAAQSFNRDQEREADLFAIKYANDNGYASLTAIKVWENFRVEQKASSNPQTRQNAANSSLFDTHPLTDERIRYLKAAAAAGGEKGVDMAAYRAVIRPHMGRWLEAEISRRDPGATLALIERLAAQGTDLGVLEYARGEAFRARDDKGDQALALASYAKATTYADAPAAAWRQIGVMHRKMGDKAAAATAFEKYLETAPAASDRQLVTDMLVTLKGGGS